MRAIPESLGGGLRSEANAETIGLTMVQPGSYVRACCYQSSRRAIASAI